MNVEELIVEHLSGWNDDTPVLLEIDGEKYRITGTDLDVDTTSLVIQGEEIEEVKRVD